jgi:hypothetical protein
MAFGSPPGPIRPTGSLAFQHTMTIQPRDAFVVVPGFAAPRTAPDESSPNSGGW